MPGSATSAAEATKSRTRTSLLAELDVDLALDSIKHPERYPLKSQL